MLDAAALLASAEATHDRLGGPGRWLLALPTDHVAGLQVLVRSVLAGVEPVTADPRDVRAVAAAARDGRARYAALVPTQLHRVVAAADGARHPARCPPSSPRWPTWTPSWSAARPHRRPCWSAAATWV